VTLISIVIPAYNAENIINDCLDSLKNQTNLDAGTTIEVIVIDDCSTDNTAFAIEEYCNKFSTSRIKFISLRQTRNQGPAAARNRGAKVSKGDYILFTDSDCIADMEWISQMIKPFADLDVSAVKGAYKTRQKELIARFAQAEFETRYRKMDSMPFIDVVFSYSAGFRRQVFLDLGGYDTGFPVADNEDTDLSYRLATAGHKISFNRKAIIYHRHPSSLKQYLGKKFTRAYWRAVVYKKYPGKAIRDSYTPHLLKLQILLMYVLATFLILLFLSPAASYGVIATLILFLLSIIPFMAQLPIRHLDLILTAPFILFGRAIVMATGLLFVIPRLLSKNSLAPSK